MRYIALLLFSALPVIAQTAREIVLHSLSVDNRNDRAIRNYTYKTREEARMLDSSGAVKLTITSLAETIYIGGKRYIKVLEKDGKPLSPKEAAAIQQKLDKAVAETNGLSAKERAKRQAEAEKDHAKEREQMNAIPNAFTFQLAGETTLNGRSAWQILAQPNPAYRGEYAGLFHNLSATLWIDKQDYQWVKVEAVTLGTVSFGLFLARIAPGSTLAFESAKINDELWAPASVEVKATARLLLLKNLHQDMRLDFSDYRRFSSDSRLISTEASE